MYLSYSAILLIAALVLLPLAILYYYNRQNSKKINDPRRDLTPNATNYNIDGIFTEEDLENASPAEIREIIRKVEKGELSSLSNDDFYRLKEKLNQSA